AALPRCGGTAARGGRHAAGTPGMNELQIIQNQLQTERRHLEQAAAACAAALNAVDTRTGERFLDACSGYFSFALAQADPERIRLASAAPGLLPVPKALDGPERWRSFLEACRWLMARHFDALQALQSESQSITTWRRRSGIDADSILAERT